MNLPHLEILLSEESGLIQAELGFVLLLSLAALVAIVIRRIRLPYTVALVIVGLILSFVPNPFVFDLSSEIILAILVPPLIFEATLNIRWVYLRQNLNLILLLAVAGTLLGTVIVGTIVILAQRTFVAELDLPLAAALAFGALISATDPVAVIALFRDLGVSKKLAILVEGESLFNDGVAIVIFSIALAAGAVGATGEGEAYTLTTGLIEFFRVSFGGLITGILLGSAVSYFILRNVDDHLIETATSVALAFGSFVVAEQLEVSGVLAVVAAGIIVGNVGMQNTSPTTKITLENFWEFLAFVVNSLVFLLIGLEAELLQFRPNLPLILVAIVAVLLSRGVVVYGLSWLHGRLDIKHKIPTTYRHVMYWGGLRGAISLALALSLTGEMFSPEIVSELRLMTFGVVLFTLLVQGTTLAPILNRLGLTARSEQKHSQFREQASIYANRAGRRELDRLYEQGILAGVMYQSMSEIYDDQIENHDQSLRELLHDYPELEQDIILEVRRDLLEAERSAVGDALRRGLIPEDVYHELIRKTDNRIAALGLIGEAMRGQSNPGHQD